MRVARVAAQQGAAADERWQRRLVAPPPTARFARGAARAIWRRGRVGYRLRSAALAAERRSVMRPEKGDAFVLRASFFPLTFALSAWVSPPASARLFARCSARACVTSSARRPRFGLGLRPRLLEPCGVGCQARAGSGIGLRPGPHSVRALVAPLVGGNAGQAPARHDSEPGLVGAAACSRPTSAAGFATRFSSLALGRPF
jgi:hypothetical protein